MHSSNHTLRCASLVGSLNPLALMPDSEPRFTSHGITGPYIDDVRTKIALALCFGIAWYNAIELCVIVFVVFNQRRGLYFYSLLVSAIVGVIPYTLGFFLKFFTILESPYLALVLLSIGWWFMVTGQSLVLWSRLHLVVQDRHVLQPLLYLILIDVLLLHVPTTTMTFIANTVNRHSLLNGYNIMEKIQMTGFSLQELLLSSVYIWEAIKMLRVSFDNKKDRKIMYQLVCINLVFIAMDLALVVLSFMDYYIYETSIKATVYSVKLKLEFAVLGRMIRFAQSHAVPVDFGQGSKWTPEITLSANGFPDFVDPSRLQHDVTHAPYSAKGPPRPPWSDPSVEGSGIGKSPTLCSCRRTASTEHEDVSSQGAGNASQHSSWRTTVEMVTTARPALVGPADGVIETPDICSLFSKQKNGRSTPSWFSIKPVLHVEVRVKNETASGALVRTDLVRDEVLQWLTDKFAVLSLDQEFTEFEARITDLPSVDLNGLWESLMFDGPLATDLLKALSRIVLLSCKKMDSWMVNWNKIALFYGPPGTGKTSLCRALAQKLSIRLSRCFPSAKLVEISAPSLGSKFFGESSKLVTTLADSVETLAEEEQEMLIMVFIDEIETLAAKREHTLAGQDPFDADPAFIDRVDIKQFVPQPSARVVYEIYRSCLTSLAASACIEGASFSIVKADHEASDSPLQCAAVATPTLELPTWADMLLWYQIFPTAAPTRLASIARKSVGLSARTLRRLPALALVLFTDGSTCRIDGALQALAQAVEEELRAKEQAGLMNG
ncbi:hypothetical protein KEM52_005298 [Ascosphaera acerosa]|nr:hypothetical protein KEM52_005298 [Ascosphaera acerosa]